MPKFLSILFFLLLTLPGFSQEETLEPLNPNSGQVTIKGNPQVPVAEADVAAPIANEDTDDIIELEDARLAHLQKIQQIEAATKPLAEPVLSPLEEIKKLGHTQLDAAAMFDKKVVAILQKTFRDGLLSKLPPEDVRTMILEKVKGSHLESLLKEFPKVLDVLVALLRDKEAFAGLLGIFARKDDLKTYGYICIGLFLFGMFVKSRIIKPKWTFFKRFRYSMTVSIILTSITFYLFFSYFGDEIAPTIDVISKNI